MVEHNPLSSTFDSEKDARLVKRAVAGSRPALNELLQRHNQFIYNISIKMLGSIEDAQDVTQDVLIKLITNLVRFDPVKAQFRTWLYRITVNHLLDYKKSVTERKIISFDQFFDFIEEIPNDDSISDEAINPLTEEAKTKCMTGMLMCVPREDRLLYILGDMFRIDHNLGAEIFDITPASFRKKLSRTRHNLRQWMNDKCGLINKANPCRCARKTKGFIERGIVDPDNLIWDKHFRRRISAYSEDNIDDALRSSDRLYTKLYRHLPFRESGELQAMLDEIMSDKNLKKILML